MTKIEFVARGERVPLEDLHDCADNPRNRSDEGIEELADSLVTHGQIVPLIVRARHGAPGYEVLAGSRRRRALLRIGAPVAIVDIVPAHVDAAAVAAAENLDRVALTFGEELALVAGFTARGRTTSTARDVAIALGRSERWARQRLSCLSLVPEARALIDSGVLTLDGAACLAAFPATVQPRILERTKGYGERSGVTREVVLWAADRARRALTLATWPLDVPGGAHGRRCDKCPTRSDAQADLFGAAPDAAAECLDPDCWGSKQAEAFAAAQADHARAGGFEIAKLDFGEFVRLDETARFGAYHSGVLCDGKRLTWGDVLAGLIPPSSVALVRIDGGPVYAAPRKEAEKLARRAFPDPAPKAPEPPDPNKPRGYWTLNNALVDALSARAWGELVTSPVPPESVLLELLFAMLGGGGYIEGEGFASALEKLPSGGAESNARKLQALLMTGALGALRFHVVDPESGELTDETCDAEAREIAVVLGVDVDDFVATTWPTWLRTSLDELGFTPAERASLGLGAFEAPTPEPEPEPKAKKRGRS